MVSRGAAITRKVGEGARARVFQQQGQLLVTVRGTAAGTPKFAGTGVSRGHGRCGGAWFHNEQRAWLGGHKHGDSLHFSPPHCPC
ncbi:putative inactive poly [Panicum miliaceum]|uniref:Inactive poly n=1 Tax=Panicum miliaceum TaxID=4540 RepID=A0A3L6RWB2_PANMI|nr:putative inactive poly [Panicum miliaceum]